MTRGSGDSVVGETEFLNVDVDVWSAASLQPLIAALGRSVSVHYVGREGRKYGAHFALTSPPSADRAIRKLAKMIAGLRGEARRSWTGARRRVFNIGLQAGTVPHSIEFQVSEAAVQAVARVGGEIVVTIYGAKRAGPRG